MRNRLLSLFFTTALLAVSAASHAATELNFIGVGEANVYTLTYNNVTEGVYVGSLVFNFGDGTQPFDLYCADLDHNISAGDQYPVTEVDTDTLPAGDPYRLAGDIYSAGVASATDANHAAGLQIAIWEAIYGNSFSLSGVSTYVEDLAADYYTQGESCNGDARLYQETSGAGQSQMGSVPGPASGLVLLIGTAGAAIRKRRK